MSNGDYTCMAGWRRTQQGTVRIHFSEQLLTVCNLCNCSPYWNLFVSNHQLHRGYKSICDYLYTNAYRILLSTYWGWNKRRPGYRRIQNGGVSVAKVRWNSATNQIDLYVGGVLKDSVASAIFATQDVYHACGFDVKIAVAGWATFYVEGVAIVTFSGDTTGGSTAIDSIVFTPKIGSSTTWNSYVYIDDIFVDNTSGEATSAIPPALTFEFIRPDADGASSGLTGSDGNQINNYQMVSEVTPDDETSYVYGASTGIKDTYNLASMRSEEHTSELQSH